VSMSDTVEVPRPVVVSCRDSLSTSVVATTDELSQATDAGEDV
jgi:hypothetical protein